MNLRRTKSFISFALSAKKIEKRASCKAINISKDAITAEKASTSKRRRRQELKEVLVGRNEILNKGAEAVFQVYLILFLAGVFLDPLRWIVAFVVVAVVRNSAPASKMSFIKMVCAAVFVAIFLEINLQMTTLETREFSVPVSLVSVAICLLIVWLINLVITLLWSRNTSSK